MFIAPHQEFPPVNGSALFITVLTKAAVFVIHAICSANSIILISISLTGLVESCLRIIKVLAAPYYFKSIGPYISIGISFSDIFRLRPASELDTSKKKTIIILQTYQFLDRA
jgi:hypothetical protein